MTLYVPNVGEKECLKAILQGKAMVLGLFNTALVPDGNTIFSSFTEMLTGGGRGYAKVELTNEIVESAAAAGKWYVSTDANGKAIGQYGAVAQEFAFAAADVADAASVYGAFMYTWRIPFDTGAIEIRPGDVVYGGTSHAYGVVTMVELQTGTWAAGTAAGYLYVKGKSGTFVDSEHLTIYGAIATLAVNVGGTGYAVGDIIQVASPLASYGRPAKLVVSTISVGVVTGLVVVDPGQGFAVDTGLVTTHLSGSGDNALTINVSTLATTTFADTNTGTSFSGDAHKQLLYVEVFPSPAPYAVTTAGQKVTYLPKFGAWSN